jgi:hypothetical protein
MLLLLIIRLIARRIVTVGKIGKYLPDFIL